jgi:hypothetical protein
VARAPDLYVSQSFKWRKELCKPDVDPHAWLADVWDVWARIAEHPAHKLEDLLLWNGGLAKRWRTKQRSLILPP